MRSPTIWPAVLPSTLPVILISVAETIWDPKTLYSSLLSSPMMQRLLESVSQWNQSLSSFSATLSVLSRLKCSALLLPLGLFADASTKTTAVAMWPLSRATLSATCLSVCLSASSDAV